MRPPCVPGLLALRTARRERTHGRVNLRSGLERRAELFLPPFGLAAVEVVLDLLDVLGQVALPAAQLLLALADLRLALLELVLADVVVGLEARLAQKQLALAILERRALDGRRRWSLRLLCELPLRVREPSLGVDERCLSQRQLLLAPL